MMKRIFPNEEAETRFLYGKCFSISHRRPFFPPEKEKKPRGTRENDSKCPRVRRVCLRLKEMKDLLNALNMNC